MWYTDDLLLRLDFRDPEPEVIDISPEGGVVSTLQESKVECLSAEKVGHRSLLLDKYLFNFNFTGCILVLLPSSIPRSIAGVPILY